MKKFMAFFYSNKKKEGIKTSILLLTVLQKFKYSTRVIVQQVGQFFNPILIPGILCGPPQAARRNV